MMVILTRIKNLRLPTQKLVFLSALLFALTVNKSFACVEINYTENVQMICRHYWKDKGKDKITELTFYKKGCEKMEGSKAEDCYFVKTCDSSFISAPIFKDPKWLNAHCKFSNPALRVVLGSPDEFPPSPVQARLICKDNKVVSLEMSSEDKKRPTVCQFK